MSGDLLILDEKWRGAYKSAYHVGVVLYETTPDEWSGSRRWVIMWVGGELGAYVDGTFDDVWTTIPKPPL